MISLASFLPALCEPTGLSEAALYERQRRLVRLGVLPKATGRGRISGGARATPHTVAALLIGILRTDNLSEFDDRVVKALRMKPIKGMDPPGKCRLTGAKTFHGAVASLIAAGSESDLANTVSVQVFRSERMRFRGQLVKPDDLLHPHPSMFDLPGPESWSPTGPEIAIRASMSVWNVARLLEEANGNSP